MTPNLIDELINNFIAAHPDADKTLLESFNKFSKDWLLDKKIIGAGHSVNGFAVRFADNTEAVVYEDEGAVTDSLAVGISGLAGRSDRTAVDNSSLRITGK